MRIVTALLLVFLALPALAQPCDPAATDEVCPDTTDWHRYFPLEAGNQWQYVQDYYGPEPDTYFGVEIVGEGEIGDVPYFFLRECDSDAESVSCGEETAVRYDEETRRVVEYREGTEEAPYGLHFGVCDFGLSFGELQECGDVGLISVYGQYGASIDLDGGEVASGTLKAFGSVGGTATYLSGVGLTKREYEQPVFEFELAFARIDGVEYGTPAFIFPTSSEPEVAQPVVTGLTAAFPNPARGAMQAQYTLDAPQTVALELIDLLGRRVRETELGPQPAGAHDIQLDLDGLRPGLYVLRLRGDAGAKATRRVVVVR
jgi:hypothetical protein